MSKSAKDTKGSVAPNCADVLARVAELAAARNDSALARALGVSAQTLSTWRQRKTVPYEAASQFALKHGFTLDYVLLGRGPALSVSPDQTRTMLMMIAAKLRKHGVVGDTMAQATAIYDRIMADAKASADPIGLVDAEVNYIISCMPELSRKRS